MMPSKQFGSDYKPVPPAAIEQCDNCDDNQPVTYVDAGNWAYHGKQMTDQQTAYSNDGHWQQPSGAPVGHFESQGYGQPGYASGATAYRTTTWPYPGQSDAVAIPQAIYHTSEGWVYYNNDVQYWNQQNASAFSSGGLGHETTTSSASQPYSYSGCKDTSQGKPGGSKMNTLAATHGHMPFQSTYQSPDGWQHRTALIDPVAITEPHPRESLPVWKWRTALVAFNITTMISGYDVSNVANIQGSVLEAFGKVELLPWLALSYSVCNVAITPLARKLFKFYDIKILIIVACLIYITGAALAGASPNFSTLIVGRSLMAIAAGIGYQGILSYVIVFSYSTEISLVQASFGATFAFGILTGPVIGAGFSQTPHATWRWSFYLVLPMMIFALLLLALTLPNYSVATEKSVSKHFKEIDWIGHTLHVSLFVLLAVTCVYSGDTWAWSSIPELTVWIVIGSLTLSYGLQQFFSLGVKPERRILPVHLFKHRAVLFSWFCTFSAALTYGVTLYYTPLLYIFAQDTNPLEVGLRLLCFTASFIISTFVAHGLLPVVKYYMPIFQVGATLLLIGGVLFHTISPATSTGTVMGFDILIGAGVGTLWNLAIPVCSIVLKDREDRLDMTTLHSVAQLGGTAIALSASALIYHNEGITLLRPSFNGYSTDDLMGLLSGTESSILMAFPAEVRTLVTNAIITTIVKCFTIAIAAGVLAFIAAAALRVEPLEFRRSRGSKGDTEDDPDKLKEKMAAF
ncbi:major facilitator superfamily domain-containing protein [Xylariaceae sp. FL0255]|nr:major facilitator superfamily domain-containing protein [Xylariaceae sp. FL0255]